MTHDWRVAPPSDPTGAEARMTAGGPCICRQYQTGPDGISKCVKWSPPGCGDAPFNVANFEKEKIHDIKNSIRESIKEKVLQKSTFQSDKVAIHYGDRNVLRNIANTVVSNIRTFNMFLEEF